MVELIKKEWTLLVTCAIAILAIILFPFTASAADSKNSESHFTDSSQKSFTFFEDFYDSNQIPNEDSAENGVNNQCVSVYNDGTLEITSYFESLINPKTGELRPSPYPMPGARVKIKNLTDRNIKITKSMLVANDGFENYDFGEWGLWDDDRWLFKGEKNTEFKPYMSDIEHWDYIIPANFEEISNKISIYRQPDVGDIQDLANKVPFRFVYEYEEVSTLNYMVNIYGFGQDEVDGGAGLANITFGPAVGETSDCLHIDGHEEHGKSHGGHCICEDSWNEIIKNCNEGHADYYSACLNYHCAKSVPITLNSTIGTQPTEDQYASTLYSSIFNKYKQWNSWYMSDDNECLNYATSRIRATLNGKTGSESTYAGDNLLDSTNCLLSCFPSNLQIAIKTKHFRVPTSWTPYEPYPISNFVYIDDKLWLLNAEEVYGASVQISRPWQWEWGKDQYKRNFDIGITISNTTSNLFWSELQWSDAPLLRCPARAGSVHYKDEYFDIGLINFSGELTEAAVDTEWYSLAFCFCL